MHFFYKPTVKPKIRHKDFYIYPNPASNVINIVNDTSDKNITIELYDVSGKQVKKQIYIAGFKSEMFNVQNMAAGVYTLKIINQQSKIIFNEKVVVNTRD
jgi:Secretion system C-terminal sorting domain